MNIHKMKRYKLGGCTISGCHAEVELTIVARGKPAKVVFVCNKTGEKRGTLAEFPEEITLGGLFLHNEYAKICANALNRIMFKK